jgi:hypothetical protein
MAPTRRYRAIMRRPWNRESRGGSEEPVRIADLVDLADRALNEATRPPSQLARASSRPLADRALSPS